MDSRSRVHSVIVTTFFPSPFSHHPKLSGSPHHHATHAGILLDLPLFACAVLASAAPSVAAESESAALTSTASSGAVDPESATLADATVTDLDVVLEEVLIEARRASPLTGRIHGRHLTSTPSANLSEALVLLPGVSGVARGARSLEPVVRGQGWERVATEVGCVSVHGACPARMDPPASYIQPHAVETVEVSKGLGSIASGIDGIGGTIRIPTDYERPLDVAPGFERFSSSAFDAARAGLRFETGLRGGGSSYDLRASAAWARFEDYATPSGQTVPADQEEMGASLSLGFRPQIGHRLYTSLDYTHGADVDFPALPMDSRETDYLVWNGGYRWEPRGQYVRNLVVEGGLAAIDHLMDNEATGNRAQLQTEAPSESRTYAGSLRLGLSLRPRTDASAGARIEQVTRDATRTRYLPGTGQTFHDHLWPEASQLQASVFVHLNRTFGAAWTAGLGLRGGLARSQAEAADDPSIGGRTIAEQYERFYGVDAAEIDRTEGLLGAEADLSWKPNDALRVYGGLDLATRPASITERYFAFGPAAGGFEVGDPSLHAERKLGVEIGADLGHRFVDAGFSIYHHRIEDSILPTTIAQIDVNGDGTVDRVRGFENVSARFQGFEVAVLGRLHERVDVPVTLAFVSGENRSDGRPLPEIPPLEGTAAVHARLDPGERLHLELRARFAAEQDEIDRQFGEDESPAWVSWRLESAYRIGPGIRLQVGVENLFDTEYHEHLSREALTVSGDLAAGAEVPTTGRSFFAVIAATY